MTMWQTLRFLVVGTTTFRPNETIYAVFSYIFLCKQEVSEVGAVLTNFVHEGVSLSSCMVMISETNRSSLLLLCDGKHIVCISGVDKQTGFVSCWDPEIQIYEVI